MNKLGNDENTNAYEVVPCPQSSASYFVDHRSTLPTRERLHEHSSKIVSVSMVCMLVLEEQRTLASCTSLKATAAPPISHIARSRPLHRAINTSLTSVASLRSPVSLFSNRVVAGESANKMLDSATPRPFLNELMRPFISAADPRVCSARAKRLMFSAVAASYVKKRMRSPAWKRET